MRIPDLIEEHIMIIDEDRTTTVSLTHNQWPNKPRTNNDRTNLKPGNSNKAAEPADYLDR